MTKKILYSWWGYLSDKPGISSPDGNASYSWSIIQEFQNRGWETYGVKDRDKSIVDKLGIEAFASFAKQKRFNAYSKIKFADCLLPKVDLVLLEWRFPTRDNQLSVTDENYSPDLLIQDLIIEKYSGNTPIIVFDLDYKFTEADELRLTPHKVLETALLPKNNHTSVFIPFDFEEILKIQTRSINTNRKLTYIGNDYDRRTDIENKIVPYSEKHPNEVIFVGNWLKDDKKELRDKWNCIKFEDRIGFNEFKDKLQSTVCVPLLATEEYKKHGYMTMRILESIIFGSVPLGFSDFYGIDKFLPDNLIIDMNNYEKDMEEKIDNLCRMGMFDRINLRQSLAERLKFMDCQNFVDEVLK